MIELLRQIFDAGRLLEAGDFCPISAKRNVLRLIVGKKIGARRVATYRRIEVLHHRFVEKLVQPQLSHLAVQPVVKGILPVLAIPLVQFYTAVLERDHRLPVLIKIPDRRTEHAPVLIEFDQICQGKRQVLESVMQLSRRRNVNRSEGKPTDDENIGAGKTDRAHPVESPAIGRRFRLRADDFIWNIW